MDRPTSFALVAVAVLVCTGHDVSGQSTRAWLGLGLAGGAATVIDGGLGLASRLVLQRGSGHYELRAIVLSDFSGFPDGGDGAVGDVGLLYGRSRSNMLGSVSAAIGPAVAWTDECGPSGGSGCYAPGLGFTVGAAIQSRLLGVGLQAFGNLNTNAPFGGIVLELNLGWMPGT